MHIIIEVNIFKKKLFLGNILSDLGRTEEAIKDYSTAIEINPQYANAYYNRG